ncbi:MAG TPA: glycosyltransferase family 4 protein [Candidatus Kapabacteria bacterium]|nr:glycosyltransferase family 4 protein [Candidatus Kapabacteria bacterium]
MNKKFVTIFSVYKDFHFYKDPGQIPYWFASLYGFDSTIVCYNNDTYKITGKYLNMHFFKKRKKHFNFLFNDMAFLIKNAKKIAVLNLIQFDLKNLINAAVYKKLNKGGFCYLRLDFSKVGKSGLAPDEIHWFRNSKKIKYRLINFLKLKLVRYVDTWSLQDNESREYYLGKYDFFKEKLTLSYNGFTTEFYKNIQLKDFKDKKDIILTVGLIGSSAKATEILLQAMTKIKNLGNWELHLAGEIENDFKDYITEFFITYPDIKTKLVFHNYLEKDKLYDLYNQAKIFCLPSRYEGMPLVIPEAMYFKNALLITNLGCSQFVTDNEKAGFIVEKNNSSRLAEYLEKLMNEPDLLKQMGNHAHLVAANHLKWEIIVEKLYNDFITHGFKY